VRIPSNGTIHEATHIGITPLEHSHLVGVMSSLTAARELWVISHSPYDDPTDNYENIRLTYLSEPALSQRRLSEGQRVEFENDQDTTIHGRVFLPQGEGPFPMVFYLHGDEEGGGWHDWWMPYWNPNAFLAEGYAVVTINPTGAEGYSDGESFVSTCDGHC
jgi:dipeptidyl aminopeptidase/acylaminoacyl peptidase